MTRRGPNEGSIYQRADGRWEGAVHMGYENGRRVRKFAIGRTRAEVAAKLGPILKARDERRPVPDQRRKLGPFLRQWLDGVAKPTVRYSTCKPRPHPRREAHPRRCAGVPRRQASVGALAEARRVHPCHPASSARDG